MDEMTIMGLEWLTFVLLIAIMIRLIPIQHTFMDRFGKYSSMRRYWGQLVWRSRLLLCARHIIGTTGMRHYEANETPFRTMHWHIRDWDRPLHLFAYKTARTAMFISSLKSYHEYTTKGAFWEEAMHRIFQTMEIYLRRIEGVSQRHPNLEQLRLHILTNYDDPDFDLGAAIHQLDIAPTHLRRLWKTEFRKARIST